MASCSDLHLGVLFRFISGLPHGAYFGVGSIVADRLAPRGKSTSAIAIMCSGMTVANLIGIPAGTWLSDMISWRVISCSTVHGHPHLHPALPSGSANGTSSEHRTERAVPFPEKCGTLAHHGHDHFRKRRYLLLVQLYQPLMNRIAGFAPSEITMLMVLAGGSMCVGNLLGGKLADRYTPGKTILAYRRS